MRGFSGSDARNGSKRKPSVPAVQPVQAGRFHRSRSLRHRTLDIVRNTSMFLYENKRACYEMQRWFRCRPTRLRAIQGLPRVTTANAIQ
ncbi:protein of unknown function (plasmid) [Azospirillum lipoferum 4B]|uniref:Uncharacterized protein n=1 Tax=Azospirillum lipoferum (strain 4B) TaxID=862719 RepID=G7ZI79_AZOL4|nr:protein of unknown function [Azospirillum lipoferum 4B]